MHPPSPHTEYDATASDGRAERYALTPQQQRDVLAAFTALLNGDCDRVFGYIAGGRICVEEVTRDKRRAA